MIPSGHHEDPFTYPSMACPHCRFHFTFVEPFGEYEITACVRCGREVDIPVAIIAEFRINTEFAEYLKTRQKPAPPPANP